MPLRPCLGVHGHTCNRLTPHRRCPDCQAEIQRRTATARPSWQDRYGPDWPRISAAVIAEHPACVLCGQEGGEDDYGDPNPLTAGHKVSRKCGGTNDPDNLQTECRRCNSRKACECPKHNPPSYRIR